MEGIIFISAYCMGIALSWNFKCEELKIGLQYSISAGVAIKLIEQCTPALNRVSSHAFNDTTWSNPYSTGIVHLKHIKIF